MRAIVKTKPEPSVELSIVEKPRIRSDQVLVEVKAVAICGSDLDIYDHTPAYSEMKLPVVSAGTARADTLTSAKPQGILENVGTPR